MVPRPAARRLLFCDRRPQALNLMSSTIRRMKQLNAHISSTANSASTPTTATPQASEEPHVLFREQYAARVYTLNRPKAYNALSYEMVQMLQKQIKAWNESELCSTIIGTGKGHFCAGGDVKNIVTLIKDESTRDQAIAFFRDEFMLDFQLSQLRKPYVVIMDGITMGGGVGLSMHAPFRVATEKTLFAMPETDIGYFTDVGATHFLAHLDGQLGTYLGLSSARVTGREVFECGIATHYVPSRNIPLLLERLSRLEDASYNVIDQTIDEFYEHRTSGGGTHDDPPPLLVGDVRVAIDQAFSPQDPVKIMENLDALSQGRPIASARTSTVVKGKQSPDAQKPSSGTPPVETLGATKVEPTPPVSAAVEAWAKKTMQSIQDRSPTSVCVTREAIYRAKEKTLQGAFETEMGLAKAFCTTLAGDFVEGVEAKLVKKGLDGPPKWNPKRLSEVDQKMVQTLVATAGREGKAVNGFVLDVKEKNAAGRQESYGLPSEEMIHKVVVGERTKGKGSKKPKQTKEEIMEQVVKAFKGKHGVREKVQEVLTRRTREGVEWIDL